MMLTQTDRYGVVVNSDNQTYSWKDEPEMNTPTKNCIQINMMTSGEKMEIADSVMMNHNAVKIVFFLP